MPSTIAIQPLLYRIAEGDPRALAELYDATDVYVFGILRRMLWSAESAESVMQDVFAQVWKTAGTFDPERGSAWSWLALLTRSRAIQRVRAESTYREAVDALMRRQPLSDPPASEARGEARVAASQRAELVRAALSELPGDQRRALELAFFGGLTHREIADRTHASLDSVKTRIRTAMQTLRDRLGSAVEA